ncbi:hypothetical protein, partial [Chromobacterium vaccinii]|uniref:hypothetical protein n=1 Tax=Chromobacterium vaccinii TaxID=1108595 RepID=UPI00345AC68E
LGDYPPLAKFAAAPFGIIESGSDAALPITLRGVEANLKIKSVQLGGQSLRLTRDADMMAWLAKVHRYHESNLPAGKDDNINFPLHQAGRADIVNISAGDGSNSAMNRIREGISQQKATVAEPCNQQGWQMADELNRSFARQPPSGFVSKPILVT